MNKNTATRYINSAKHPIRFDRQHPNSLFKIVAEPSRGIRRSNDERIYRKAKDHEGFYAVLEGDHEIAVCLMPYDIVQPVRAVK